MKRIYWIFWLAVATHLVWGALLLFTSDGAAWVTSINHTISLGFNRFTLGTVYILASVCSVYGLLSSTKYRMLVMGPQQCLLLLSALGNCVAISHSAFADGVVRPWEFIMADQSPSVLLAVFHTLALLEEPFRR